LAIEASQPFFSARIILPHVDDAPAARIKAQSFKSTMLDKIADQRRADFT
jgi:hypothetical protein